MTVFSSLGYRVKSANIKCLEVATWAVGFRSLKFLWCHCDWLMISDTCLQKELGSTDILAVLVLGPSSLSDLSYLFFFALNCPWIYLLDFLNHWIWPFPSLFDAWFWLLLVTSSLIFIEQRTDQWALLRWTYVFDSPGPRYSVLFLDYI